MDHTLHIKQVTTFAAGQSSTSVTQSHTMNVEPRIQPRGLTATFHPIGVKYGPMGKIGIDASSDSDGDVAMNEAPPLPRSSQSKDTAIDTPKTDKKKRKHRIDDEATIPSSQNEKAPESRKKAKKARLAEQDDAAASTKPAEAVALAPPSSKKKSKISSSQPAPARTPSAKAPAVKMASSPIGRTAQQKTALDSDRLSSTQPLPPSTQPAPSYKVSSSKQTPIPPPRIGRLSSNSTSRPTEPVSVSSASEKQEVEIKDSKAKSKKKSSKKAPAEAHSKTDEDSASATKAINNIATHPRKETPIMPPIRGSKKP